VWRHILLFVITLLSTTAVGSRLAVNFDQNRPTYIDDLWAAITAVADPSSLVAGLPFSATLLTILLAHEMGHYLTCRYYGIDASLPYFLPAPTLIGTFGAFIRIRSAIPTKKQLFDVGIAGPLAGFAFVIPALAVGLAYSKIIPGIAVQGDFVFGTPGIMRILESWIMPGVSSADILVHPIARAAWAGVLATALNLMPIGQLDGGHILYSFVGEYHKLLTRLFVFALLPLGYFTDSFSWIFWAALIFFFGMKHPRLYDRTPLGRGRTQLAILALIILVVSFSPSPVRA
jgi:membrane-associated protease RseP (regulator of RpoE activity)